MSKRYRFELNGLTPILFHQNNIVARDEMASRGRTGGKAGDDRHPADTWKTYLYTIGGMVVIPVENVMSMLLAGGKKIQVKGKQTLKLASQSIFCDQTEFPLEYGPKGRNLTEEEVLAVDGEFGAHVEAVKALGFELFVKPVKVNSSSHVRVRPKFSPPWRISGTFEADDEYLTHERIEHLWEICSRKVGLGDWRPGSTTPGQYGRFNVKLTKI